MKSACLFIFTCLFQHFLFAQKQEALSRLHVQAELLHAFYISSPYGGPWSPGPGLRIQAGGNLAKGELFVAAARSNYNSDSLPDFTSTLLTLGYGFNIPLYKSIVLKPALAFGNNYMQFDIESPSSHKNESELTLEMSLRVEAQLYKNLYASLGLRGHRTLLYHRLDAIHASGALVYYFGTPRIIKKLID